MTDRKKYAGKAKPFLEGKPADEYTARYALKFFGSLILVAFMTFIVCSMTSFDSGILRIAINAVIETLILLIFFNKGAEFGTEGVSRGEILYQHVEKGQEVSVNEKKIPFHKAKGYVIGILGTLPLLIIAILLAVTAEKQMTGAGVLPSWMEAYMRRNEISDALTAYSQGSAFLAADLLRIIVRVNIMPFVSMCGGENRNLMLILERISPLLVLLPAAAYGTGYLQGPSHRRRIHTEIAENARKRRIREKREKRARNNNSKEPQQLN